LPSFILFIYPLLPISTLFLTWPVLHSCSSLFKHLFVVLWGFGHGILPVSILHFNQSNPSSTLPHPFPLLCIVQQFSVCFLVSCSYTDVICLIIIHSPSFFPSFPSPWVYLSVSLLEICSVYLYIFIYDNTCAYVGFIFTYERKHLTSIFLYPG
jgi:hypothetical protein